MKSAYVQHSVLASVSAVERFNLLTDVRDLHRPERARKRGEWGVDIVAWLDDLSPLTASDKAALELLVGGGTTRRTRGPSNQK